MWSPFYRGLKIVWKNFVMNIFSRPSSRENFQQIPCASIHAKSIIFITARFVHDQKVYRLCPLNGLSRWKYPISLYLNLLQWSLHIQIFQPSESQHVKILLITRLMGLYGKGYLLDAMSRIWYLLHAFLSTVCYSRTIVK